MLKRVALGLIDVYRLLISPLFGPSCRFHPSCSHYMRQAIVRYGLFRGARLGLLRLCRCHPWNPGGYDPLR